MTRTTTRTAILAATGLVACAAIARADVVWGEPQVNPDKKNRLACVDKTNTGAVPKCDYTKGQQYKSDIGSVNGTQAPCHEATAVYSWGRCVGCQLKAGEPDCVAKYRKCASFKFYTQIQQQLVNGQFQYSCKGNVIKDNMGNTIIKDRYVADACVPAGAVPQNGAGGQSTNCIGIE